MRDLDGDVFAERLLLIIDEGQRVATYKLALLLALIDACAEHADDDGRAPENLHTRVIARHVLRLYFPQVRAFLAGTGDELQLRQITAKRSVVLAAVLRLHLLAAPLRLRTLSELARRIPDEYERCLDEVELAFARYPLRLLQVVGREDRPFLYDIDWRDSVGLRALHAPGGGLVRLRTGAGDQLLRLAPLVRPLVELHWTRMVARLNGVAPEEERLHAHLFGEDRAKFSAALRSGLADLQGGTCFYCNDRLGPRSEIDHFLPWARWPNNAVENLVLADRCNNSKRDFLPALVHVERWSDRLSTRQSDLADLAARSSSPTEPTRSLALARSCWAHVATGTPFWLIDREFTDDDPDDFVRRLASVAL